MNNRIGFIASDIEMEQIILDLYSNRIENNELMIQIFDNNSVENQGKKMEEAGADVIIARSGGYLYNEGKVTVPLLKLKVSTSDLMIALHKASRINRNIDLFLWDQIYFDREILKILDIHVNVHLFSDGNEIESLFNDVIDGAYNGMIVGEGVVCSLSRRANIPYIFINPSEDSIKEIMNYADEVLLGLKEIRYKNDLLTTVIQGGYDAVLGFDEAYKITLFNARAEALFMLESENVKGKDILEVCPEFKIFVDSFNAREEAYGKLFKYNQMTLTFNTSIIKLDNSVKGYLVSFQDITKLQKLEQKIRYEISDRGLIGKYTFDDVIYTGKLMEDVVKKAKIISKSNTTAMIYGGSGTGKEIFASSMHNLSNRSFGPFVAVNCAALSESLLESELFGYEEGAFTGARKGGKPGLFEIAHGGTIFLDEINSMSLAIQSKLLRVVEQKDVMRIGSDKVIPLDVRIICAANEQLDDLVKNDKFRKDLFYRLNSLELYLPPLRERKEDILLMVEQFLKRDLQDESLNKLSDYEKERLLAYDWPGNVRELKSVCERYILFGEFGIPEVRSYGEKSEIQVLENIKIDLKEIHKNIERHIILELLEGGLSKTQVADLLGISRTVLWRKMSD